MLNRRGGEPLVVDRFPRLAIVMTLLLTAIVAFAIPSLERDQSLEVWFFPDDPNLQVYDHFTRLFRSDEIIVIGLFVDDIFVLENWEAMEELADSLLELRHVEAVISPTSLGNLNPYPVEGEASLREQVFSNSLLKGNLIGENGDAAAVVIQLSREANNFANKRTIVDVLRRTIADSPAATLMDVRIAGTPVSDDASMRHNERDMTRIVPLMVIMILVITALVFRHIVLAVLPLVVVILSLLWTFAASAILGFKFTLLSSALLPLILAVGVADSIHLITRYLHNLGEGMDSSNAAIESRRNMFLPCLFTSGTTAGGLLALLVSSLAPIREFGVTAAIGVCAAFIISMVLVPAVLIGVKSDRVKGLAGDNMVSRFFSSNGLPSVGSQRLLILGFGLVFVASMWSATRVDVTVGPLSWFPEDDPVLLDTVKIDQALGGSLAVEFLVTTLPYSLQDRATLQRLDDFERWLEENTEVTRVFSMVDVLKEIGRTGQVDASAQPVLPHKQSLKTLFANLEDSDAISRWVDKDFGVARLSARTSLTRAAIAIEQLPMIEMEIEKRFPESHFNVQMTGYAPLGVKMKEYVLESQIESLAVAFLVVTLMIGLLLRSSILAVVAMIPNLVPIAIGLGSMNLLGINLNPGTVMIGAITMGIVVDDTVHFMVELKKKLHRQIDIEDCLRGTVRSVGVPVVITSLILTLGFSFLTLGDFGPVRDVGLVTAIIVVTALIADIYLLPSVLRLMPEKWLQKLGQ